MIGIVYGSSMGNTEDAAKLISEGLGLENELLNVADVDAAKLNSFDKLVLGTSTWGSGDLQDDWDAFNFKALNLSGKTVAVFGMGDSESYSDEYCNGMAKLYDEVVKAGNAATRCGRFRCLHPRFRAIRCATKTRGRVCLNARC